eukprot:6719733-Pyramimonas_sp.AAC.1
MYPRKGRSVEAQGDTVLNGLGAMSIVRSCVAITRSSHSACSAIGRGSNGIRYMDVFASSTHSRHNSPLTWITSSTYLVDATVVFQDCQRRTNP